MIDIDYGNIEINLEKIIEKQNISINKLANRSEMQRTQLKQYIKNKVTRIDLSVLSRLCYVLECDISDILSYKKPNKKRVQ